MRKREGRTGIFSRNSMLDVKLEGDGGDCLPRKGIGEETKL